MGTLNETDYVAFIGIDWANAKHDVCIQGAGSEQREFAVIAHQVERIEEWAQAMKQRFGSPIAVAVELTKGPIVSALQKYDFFVIYPINPTTLAKYREAFTPSRAKDDPTDAELALDLILRHPERFSPLQPQSVEMRTLASLVEHRRRLVDDRKRITNRLRYALKQYYPQALDWFEQLDTVLFCDFLTRWPTLPQVKRARNNTLLTFFHQHNMRFAQVSEARLASIKTATPLTMDEAVIMPHRLSSRIVYCHWYLLSSCVSPWMRLNNLIRRLKSWQASMWIMDCSVHCQALDRHWHHDCWWPLVRTENVITMPQNCKSVQQLPR